MKVQQLERRGSHCKIYESPKGKRAVKKQTSKAFRRHFKRAGENTSGKLKEIVKGWNF